MKLHYEFNVNTTRSASSVQGYSSQQTSTALPGIKRLVVVGKALPKADESVSIDDLIADLEKDSGLAKDFANARRELAQSGKGNRMSIGDLRLAQGYSQRELARLAGLHQPNVSLIEAGRRKPDYETAAKLAAVLGVTVDDLYNAYAVEREKP